MPTTDSSSDLPPPPSHDEVSHTAVDNDSNSEPDHVRAEQQRKRAYLSLLPPDQIIELCLSFEQHVPLPIRTEIWPDDLEAEIVKLQHNTQRTSVEPIAPPAVSTSDSIVQPTNPALPTAPSQQVHPPGLSSIDLPIQPLDSSFPIASSEKHADTISDTSDAKTTTDEPRNTIDERSGEPSRSATREENSAIEPQLSKTVATSDSQNTQTPAAISATDKEDLAVSSPKPILAPFASTSATPQPAAVPPPYPYAPYGYPLPPGYPPPPGTAQAAYPHTPYYPPPGSVPGYPAHYPGYPPYPPPPGYSTHQPPPPPPPVSGEDLPSYEDMIVEALLDIGEPDGAAPKDLFLWMGARWPLQTNFRPSASQALQKAYRRGRLEKRSGGRYRLNPNWEGGATSKRTTRRPQTLAQTTYAMHQSTSAQTPPSSSPFTTAPLPQRAHISPPPHHTAQQQPYGAYAYPYGAYAGYPGYATFSARPPAKTAPSASTSSTATKTTTATAKAATKTVSSTDSGKGKDSSSTEEGSDAWVAAQHILKAINFGSLQENSTSTSGTVATSTSTSPAAGSSQAIPPPIMASLGIDVHAGLEDDGLGRATLTDDERASLQAQLALLAAQLSEIAAEEDAEDEDAIGEIDEEVIDVSSPRNQPAEAPPPVVAPASSGDQDPGTSTVLDINQFPDDAELNVIVPEALPALAAPVEPEAAGPSPHPSEHLAAPPPMGSLAPPDEPEKLVPSSAGVPPTASASTVESEDESDDDDMEMVDVDSYMRSEGIRT